MEFDTLYFYNKVKASCETYCKRLSKLDAPNLAREQQAENLLIATKKALENYEEANKEKINKLKNEINTANTKIKDLQLTQKHLKKEKRNLVQSKQNVETKISQLQDDVWSLETLGKELDRKVESVQAKLLEKCYAHDKANNIFQTKLQCYIEVNDPEEPCITIYLLNSDKADNYFVKLRNKEGQWSILQLQPELNCQKAIAKQLEDSSDIQGCLCLIRKKFKKLQEQK